MKENLIRLSVVIAEIVYLFLIFFFCYTAVNKFLNISSFRINMIKTSIFDESLAFYMSYFIILLEFSVVLVLFLNKFKGLLFVSFVMLIFTLYISYLNFKGFYEVCGCGGILNGLEYKYHFFINIGLFFGSIYSFFILSLGQNEK